MAATSGEGLIVDLLKQHNKPFSLQNIVDFMATQGLKKAAVSRAVDAAADGGKIVQKEFGKTKLYWAKQDGLSVHTPEDAEQKRMDIQEMQGKLSQLGAAVRALDQSVSAARSSLSDEQIEEQTLQLSAQAAEQEERLAALRGGSVLVTPEERAAVAGTLGKCIDMWRKLKGIYRENWDAVSEGLEGRTADILEAAGIETDEMVGTSIAEAQTALGKAGLAAKRMGSSGASAMAAAKRGRL